MRKRFEAEMLFAEGSAESMPDLRRRRRSVGWEVEDEGVEKKPPRGERKCLIWVPGRNGISQRLIEGHLLLFVEEKTYSLTIQPTRDSPRRK